MNNENHKLESKTSGHITVMKNDQENELKHLNGPIKWLNFLNAKQCISYLFLGCNMTPT